jgi:hypothetical protein
MSQNNNITLEIVQMRSDVLYLIRLVEKLEKKITDLEKTVEQSKPIPQDPFAGLHIEKL